MQSETLIRQTCHKLQLRTHSNLTKSRTQGWGRARFAGSNVHTQSSRYFYRAASYTFRSHLVVNNFYNLLLLYTPIDPPCFPAITLENQRCNKRPAFTLEPSNPTRRLLSPEPAVWRVFPKQQAAFDFARTCREVPT